jgi:amino acid permease
MKKLRLKIIMILCLVSVGLLVYSWIQNSYQVDFFISKNMHYHNRIIAGIEMSNDIDSVKVQAINLIENIDDRTWENNDRAIKVAKSQTAIILIFLVLLGI